MIFLETKEMNLFSCVGWQVKGIRWSLEERMIFSVLQVVNHEPG